MGNITIHQMAEQVAGLMEKRHGIRGKDLPSKLRRGRKRLPRKLRGEADLLAEAAEISAHPKLAARLDAPRLGQAHHALVRHLSPLGRSARRLDMLRDIVSTAVFGLICVIVLVVAVLYWRGHL